MLFSGCTSIGPGPTDVNAELTFCISEVNRYRGLANLPALERSGTLESFAAESARIDGIAGEPHQHFSTNNGGGVAFAETELLRWKNGSVHTVIEKGLSKMWEEGPGGEHRDILIGAYTQIGCGIFIGNTGVTVAQDYR
jgi:hypothetical protein